MERILILGAGPSARVVPEIASACEGFEILGFVDLANEKHFLVGDAADLPVYEATQFPEDLKNKLGRFRVFIATDSMAIRRQLISRVEKDDFLMAGIIHPHAFISPSAKLGRGIFISPGVIIGPGAFIGDHIMLNSAVTIDHDSILEENVVVAPGVHIPGKVLVKSDTFIGVGACCIPGVTIGKNCIIGAGSVVTRDIPDDVIAAGVPAKVIRGNV